MKTIIKEARFNASAEVSVPMDAQFIGAAAGHQTLVAFYRTSPGAEEQTTRVQLHAVASDDVTDLPPSAQYLDTIHVGLRFLHVFVVR